jgi:hypothetical protein
MIATIRACDVPTYASSPSDGPTWAVECNGVTHYRGRDLERALTVYYRHGGPRLSGQERRRLYDEADRLQRSSR